MVIITDIPNGGPSACAAPPNRLKPPTVTSSFFGTAWLEGLSSLIGVRASNPAIYENMPLARLRRKRL
jgi:hypothetical protein